MNVTFTLILWKLICFHKSSPFHRSQKICTTLYCTATAEGLKSRGLLTPVRNGICLMYWTFLRLMWQQCPSLLAVLWKHFRCCFFYLLRVSLFATCLCMCCTFLYLLRVSVMCCVVKLTKMFSYFACVLTTCMCFLKLLCVELSGPPYIRHILHCSDWL